MLLRLATRISQRPGAAIERPRIPWPLVIAAGVIVANVAAVVLSLLGQ